jgi:hypothetical protein
MAFSQGRVLEVERRALGIAEWTERGVYWKWSAERSVSPE